MCVSVFCAIRMNLVVIKSIRLDLNSFMQSDALYSEPCGM